MAFEYKVVPAPETGVKRRGLRRPGDRIAAAMAEAIAAQATHGWEYVRADVIPVQEGGGWFSRPREVQRALLVFRRARPGGRGEERDATSARETIPVAPTRLAEPAAPRRAPDPEPALRAPAAEAEMPRYPDYASYRENPAEAPAAEEPAPRRAEPRAQPRQDYRGDLFAPRRPAAEGAEERPAPARPEPGLGARRGDRPRPSTGMIEGTRRAEPRAEPPMRETPRETDHGAEAGEEPPLRPEPAPRFRPPYREQDAASGGAPAEPAEDAEPQTPDPQTPRRSADDDLSDIRSALRRLER